MRLVCADIFFHLRSLVPTDVGRVAYDGIVGERCPLLLAPCSLPLAPCPLPLEDKAQNVLSQELHLGTKALGIPAGIGKGLFRDVESRDLIARQGQRDGNAAAARPDVEHPASRRHVLLSKVHQLPCLRPRDEYTRTDQERPPAELLNAQNILHRLPFRHSIDNYLQLGFVICR